MSTEVDLVNHPPHYAAVLPNFECIELTRYLPFCRGNALKYVFRAGIKSPSLREDYAKAEWYMKQAVNDEKYINEVYGPGETTYIFCHYSPKDSVIKKYIEAETNRVRRGLVLMIVSPSTLMWEACALELQELQKLC